MWEGGHATAASSQFCHPPDKTFFRMNAARPRAGGGAGVPPAFYRRQAMRLPTIPTAGPSFRTAGPFFGAPGSFCRTVEAFYRTAEPLNRMTDSFYRAAEWFYRTAD
jgi:hypothetical protein